MGEGESASFIPTSSDVPQLFFFFFPPTETPTGSFLPEAEQEGVGEEGAV